MKEELSEFDEQHIRSALHGLDVPRRLRERIRQRLHQEANSDMPSAAGSVDGPIICKLPRQGADSQPELEITQDGAQEHLPTLASAGKLASSNRFSRRSVAVLALSLGLFGVLFTAYRFSRPLAPDRLAEFCLQAVDRLNTVESNWQPPATQELNSLSADLAGQLLSVDIIGVQDITGDPFAARCRIWALRSPTTNKRLFIFDFQDANPVQRLSSQLQSIRQASGGWSMVAMRSGERVLVVAFEGQWESYLRRPRSA